METLYKLITEKPRRMVLRKLSTKEYPYLSVEEEDEVCLVSMV